MIIMIHICHCTAICPANGLVQTAFEHVQLLLEPGINFGLVRQVMPGDAR